MADNADNLVIEDLILRWDGYATMYGSFTQRPSRANTPVCADTSLGGENCNVPMPGQYCPLVCASVTYWSNHLILDTYINYLRTNLKRVSELVLQFIYIL